MSAPGTGRGGRSADTNSMEICCDHITQRAGAPGSLRCLRGRHRAGHDRRWRRPPPRPPVRDKGKPAQSENFTGKEQKGFYDARTPNAKTTYARAAKVAGKESAASEKFRNSLGTQGVVELDPNTGTPAQVTKLNGFLTGKSAKKATDVALGYVKAHPEVFKLTDADLATLRLRKDYVDDLGTHHISWSQVVDGIEVFGNGLKANVTKSGQLISLMGSPVSGLTPGRQARSAAAAPKVTAHAARTRRHRGHRRYGEVRDREDLRREHQLQQRRHREAGVVPHRRRAAQGLDDLRQRRRHEGLHPRHRRADRRPPLPPRPGPARATATPCVQDNYPGAAKGGTQRVENLIYRQAGCRRTPRPCSTVTSVAAWADINDDNQPNNGETVKVPGTKTGAEYKLTPFQNASALCSTSFVCTWDPAKPTPGRRT